MSTPESVEAQRRPDRSQGEALIARSGHAAVDLFERALCGNAAVPSASMAEGLALAGSRAASLLAGGLGSPPAPGLLAGRAAWVHHRVRSRGPDVGERFLVQLEARTAQQALDHCLVAHLIAARLGSPVACSIEPDHAEGVHLLRLPAAELLGELLDAQGSETVVAQDSSVLREVAEAALAAVAARTGRPLETVGLTATDEPPTLRLIAAARPPLVHEAKPEESIVLAAAPACEWSERMILAASAAVGRVEKLSLHRLRRPPNGCSAVVLHAGEDVLARDGAVDLLFVAHLGLLSRPEWLASLAPGAVVLACVRGGVDSAAKLLPKRLREAVTRGSLDLRIIDPWQACDEEAPERRSLRRVLEGALLAVAPWPTGLGGPGLLERVEAAAAPDLRSLLQVGAEGVRSLKAGDLGAGLAEPLGGPRLPSETGGRAEEWRQALRHFHLTGLGAWSRAEQLPSLPLWPAALDALLESEAQAERHPLCLDAEDGRVEAAHAVLLRALAQARGAGLDVSVIEPHAPQLLRGLEETLAESGAPRPCGPAFDEMLARFSEQLDLSEAARGSLTEQIERLRERLPGSGSLLGFSATAVPLLHARAVRRVLAPRRADLLADVDALIVRLREILDLDASRGRGRATSLAAALDDGAGSLIDAEAFARTVPTTRGSRPLEPERRVLLEDALESLSRGRPLLAEPTSLIVVTAEPIPAALAALDVRELRHPDAAQAAIGVFDATVAPYEALLRARRLARLLVSGHFDPERHRPMLERFGWEGFDEDELLAVPRVVVLERGTRLRGGALASFSALLRSARPVQLLVSEDASGLLASETWEALAGYHRGLGHLAVAHREAFVAQASLTRPDHLVASFDAMARCLRPAVAVVALPSKRAAVSAWAQLVAALHGRATPSFRHDPTAGESWADRFDLEGNAAPEAPWPRIRHEALGPDGKSQLLESAFTFAHAAALAPTHREHFRVIPPEAWSDEQLEMGDWLAGGAAALAKLPFLWVTTDEGLLQRAVPTRELAFACRDRLEAWHVLQELAGTDNEHARRAAAAAREQALEEASEREAELRSRHERELAELAGRASREAMERLAHVLLDLDLESIARSPAAALPAESAAPTSVASAAPSVETEAPAPAVPEEPEEEDDEPLLDEPFVDSMLCTTCNECININPRLFAYDENKQARIADASAGTFQQLVIAAEKCPARCIHPGRPRAGDDTATDELVQRAAGFR